MWHKTYQIFSCFPRDRISSQIAVILVKSYGISRSHLNHRRQLLRRLHSRDGCGNITYQTFSFFSSSMFEESECDGLSSDLRYLQITFGPPNVNVTRYRSCSKSQEFLDQTWKKLSLQSDVADTLVCTTIVAGSNRAQQLQATHKSYPRGVQFYCFYYHHYQFVKLCRLHMYSSS
jgi:hypothetical protein